VQINDDGADVIECDDDANFIFLSSDGLFHHSMYYRNA